MMKKANFSMDGGVDSRLARGVGDGWDGQRTGMAGVSSRSV